MCISMADIEIKSCEYVANAACESHAYSSVVLAPCSMTEDAIIWPLFYKHLRSFNDEPIVLIKFSIFVVFIVLIS